MKVGPGRAPSNDDGAARVGILALQGAVGPHAGALVALGVESVQVRSPEDLSAVERLIIPGGESTTMSRLLDTSGLAGPLRERLRSGMPVFGTCAGMILLAREVMDGRSDQTPLDALDLTVRRNAFGRQIDSFETDLDVTGLEAPFHAVFIRAPLVERAGPDVEVLATVDSKPVLCRSGSVLVSAFHPEMTPDPRLHELFLAS